MGFKPRKSQADHPLHLDGVYLENNRRKPGGSRYISPPLDDRQLRPFKSGCVMVSICDPLSDDEYRAAARLLETNPRVWLNPPSRMTELALLRHFPHDG